MLFWTRLSQDDCEKLGTDLVITYGTYVSKVGPCLIGVCRNGVCHLSFPNDIYANVMIMQGEWPYAQLIEDDSKIERVGEALFVRKINKIEIFTAGTDFEHAVWDRLTNIPAGTTTSYKEIAEFVGKPTAIRAVSHAIKNNRIAYIIPCHRVHSTTGKTPMYKWGVERKKLLLQLERQNKLKLIS